MRERKYEYLWIVQGNYGQGWEDEAASEKFREAYADVKAYRDNCPEYPHRIIHRRELRASG